MLYSGKANVPSIRDAANQGKLDPGITGIPKGPKGRFVRNGPTSYAILQTSQHKDEGWQLIKTMTQHDAQVLHYAVGGSLPVRQSLLTSGEFAKSLAPWETIDVYLEAAKVDKPLRLVPTHPDIQAAFAAEYDLVKLGQQSYKDAAAKFVPKINALLQKAKQS